MVRIFNWLKENIGISHIYRLQAILWYKAAYWGFEQWRDYTYEEYWDKRLDEELEESVEAKEAKDIKLNFHWDDDLEDWYSDYYEQRRFEYVREVPGGNKFGNPRWVLKNNKGNCIYITSFTIYCLRKGGYKAWDERIPSDAPGVYEHSITAFYWNGKKYVMDNGRRGIKVGIKTWEKYFHPFRYFLD